MKNMKYVPISKVWDFEGWGVEMSGLIAALSITIDSLTDYPDSDIPECDALYAILCAMMKCKREFDTLYTDVCNAAVKADKITE